MRLSRTVLACLFVLTLSAAVAGQDAADPLAPSANVIESSFKLRAAGQIDIDAGTMTMSGQASHLGQFSCQGTFDAITRTFRGTMTDNSGDSANVEMTLVERVPGEFDVTIVFLGYLSHSMIGGGSGTGTLLLDPDLMFTTAIEGTMQKCLAERCLG